MGDFYEANKKGYLENTFRILRNFLKGLKCQSVQLGMHFLSKNQLFKKERLKLPWKLKTILEQVQPQNVFHSIE